MEDDNNIQQNKQSTYTTSSDWKFVNVIQFGKYPRYVVNLFKNVLALETSSSVDLEVT